MATQKWCNVAGCKNFIFATLRDFAENNWSAFAIPSTSKAVCYCPEHQEEMKKDMENKLTQKQEKTHK